MRGKKIVVISIVISLVCILICVALGLVGINIFSSQADTVTNNNFPLKQKWVYQGSEDIAAIAVSQTGQVIIRTVQSLSSLDLATGEVIWSNDLPKTFGGGAPIISNDIVIVAHSEGTNAYDLKTGKQLWQATDNISKRNTTFVAAANNEAVVVIGGFIGINDLKTGKLLWLVERNWPGDSALAAISDNELYVIFSSQIKSYNIQSGELLWEVGTPFWSLNSMLLEDNILYLELSSNVGVGAFDLQARRMIWQQRDYFKTFSNPITKFNDYLFVPIHNGVPTALNAQTGDILWQAQELPNDTYLTSAVMDNIVYVKNLYSRDLYALDLRNGTMIGNLNLGLPNIFPTIRKTSTGPLLIGSLIVFADNDRVFAYQK